MSFFPLKVGLATVMQQMGIKPADLSTVEDPKGRLDYLASKLIEKGAAGLSAELQQTYQVARPLIDGFLKEQFGKVRIQIPDMPDKGKGV